MEKSKFSDRVTLRVLRHLKKTARLGKIIRVIPYPELEIVGHLPKNGLWHFGYFLGKIDNRNAMLPPLL
jgi:hypothetical protein